MLWTDGKGLGASAIHPPPPPPLTPCPLLKLTLTFAEELVLMSLAGLQVPGISEFETWIGWRKVFLINPLTGKRTNSNSFPNDKTARETTSLINNHVSVQIVLAFQSPSNYLSLLVSFRSLPLPTIVASWCHSGGFCSGKWLEKQLQTKNLPDFSRTAR